jgi:integrase
MKGSPLAPHVLQKPWANARSQLGLGDVHLHDLRHLAGRRAPSTGAGTKELMHRLAHASPQATLRYQHATRERDVAIADAIDSLLQQNCQVMDERST